MPFMSKNLVNAQRKWTRLRNKYLKNRTETDKIYYNKQRIFGVNFLRKKKILLSEFKWKKCDR